MKKFIISIIFCLLAVFSSTILASAEDSVKKEDSITIVIDGKKSEFKDPAISVNGRTLLPLRELSISLGIPNDSNHIIWNSEDNSIILKDKTFEIKLQIDQKEAYINSKQMSLDVAPIIYNEKMYIPVRSVSQSFGRRVTWDEPSKSILISTEEAYKKTKETLEKAVLIFTGKDKYQYVKNIAAPKNNLSIDVTYNVDKRSKKAQNTYSFNYNSEVSEMDEWCQDDIRYLKYNYGDDYEYSEDSEDSWEWSLMEDNDQINMYNIFSSLYNNDLANTGLISQEQTESEIILKGDIILKDIFLTMPSNSNFFQDSFDKYVILGTTVIKIDKKSNMIKEAELTLKLKDFIGNNAYTDGGSMIVSLKNFSFTDIKDLKAPENLIDITDSMKNDYWIDLGKTYAAYDKIDLAISYFDKVINNDPNNSEAIYEKAKLLLNNNDSLDEALELYDKAVSLNPALATKYLEVGLKLYKLENYEKALIYLNKAIDAGVKSGDIYFYKGEILFKDGKYEEALDSYAEAAKIKPYYFNSIVNKVFNLRLAKKYEIALIYSEKLIELDKGSVTGYLEKSYALYYLNRIDEALEFLDTAEKLSPNDDSILEFRIAIYKKLGKEGDANALLEKALNTEAKTSGEYINKGNILYMFKRYEEAIECFDKALELNPNSSVAYYNKGLCLYFLNRYDEANLYFDKTIELNENSVSAYYWKSVVLNKLGKYEEAKQYFNKYTELNKKSVNITE